MKVIKSCTHLCFVPVVSLLHEGFHSEPQSLQRIQIDSNLLQLAHVVIVRNFKKCFSLCDFFGFFLKRFARNEYRSPQALTLEV